MRIRQEKFAIEECGSGYRIDLPQEQVGRLPSMFRGRLTLHTPSGASSIEGTLHRVAGARLIIVTNQRFELDKPAASEEGSREYRLDGSREYRLDIRGVFKPGLEADEEFLAADFDSLFARGGSTMRCGGCERDRWLSPWDLEQTICGCVHDAGGDS